MSLGHRTKSIKSGRSVQPLLEVSDLRTHFETPDGVVGAVNGVSFQVSKGEILGIVGESGCGKSVTALSILGLVPGPYGQVVSGKIHFDGRDLRSLTEREMRSVRGAEIAMIFQDPISSLNPTMTIGDQIAEMLYVHQHSRGDRGRRRAIELLDRVGIPDPAHRVDHYPHQLSGGMRQRVMIAMALSCSPRLLIADEPTTALDVTIQAQILELVRRLRDEYEMSVITITHDLGVLAGLADRLAVMYAGRIVETGPVDEVFSRPEHPYTRGLLRSTLRLDEARTARLTPIEGAPPDLGDPLPGCPFEPRCVFAEARCRVKDPPLEKIDVHHAVACWVDLPRLSLRVHDATVQPERARESNRLLGVDHLTKTFKLNRGLLRRARSLYAVNDVSFEIARGETVGLVGESGCGKSTLGRTLLQLYEPTSGSVVFDDQELTQLSQRQMRRVRRHMQIVFQDPYTSLDPRMRVGRLIAEPIRIHGMADQVDGDARVIELLDLVGLRQDSARRYPHEFSGGQRQRIAIARALAVNPSFLILDEPVSSLDVSVQAQIINLLDELQQALGLTYLLIAHDLSLVRHVSDRVAVMYLGRIVELGDRDDLYRQPLHPYTHALLSAVPIPDPSVERERERTILSGDVPSPVSHQVGCSFRARCPLRKALGDPKICESETPLLQIQRERHMAACHFSAEMLTIQSPV